MTKVLWDSKDAALATGGKNTCNWVASGISIDTRTLKKGDIFIAINDNRDGHDFVLKAFENGAAAAIVSRIPDGVCDTKPLLIVQDVTSALNGLAAFARKRCQAKVIAITGSVGKTSSKDMLETALLTFGKVSKAEKSFNNHIGVPLTLAKAPTDTNFLIVEIGMSNKKEIYPLSVLVRPDIALITNVSEAHLAAFNNVDEIAREKSDICAGLVKEGQCIVSKDSDSYSKLIRFIRGFGIKAVSYGENSPVDYRLIKTATINNRTCAQALLRNGDEFFFKVNSPGSHHAQNALGVIAVLELLGLDATKGILGLSNWVPTSGRGVIMSVTCDKQYVPRTFTIIDETYNANPSSMVAAINVLAKFDRSREPTQQKRRFRRIAILGDMLELGSQENKKHAELVKKLILDDIDLVHCVGVRMKFFYEHLPVTKRGKWTKSVMEFTKTAKELIKDNDVVMLKASNGVGLDRLLVELKAMGVPN